MHAVLSDLVAAAVREGKLLPQSRENIALLLGGAVTSLYGKVVLELAEAGQWAELNDRFFRTLSFGTGGLRGRTIGRVVTQAERGSAAEGEPPEHPCVGTNAMNFYNVSRATRGLAHYVWERFLEEGRQGRPKVVVCHDTRHFSRAFAELAAKIFSELGIDALLFREARSTPQLSFSIRYYGAMAGVNITASHNPPAYNGYKVYFEDGGQIVEPHASGIIAKVRDVKGEAHEPIEAEEQGRIVALGADADEAYGRALDALVIEPERVKQFAPKVVFSALHGVGGAATLPALKRFGVQYSVVAEQMVPDGNFSTVKSPNPEERSALDKAIEQAEREGAELVMASDPDADRLGVAVRGDDGRFELLTGNQIGSVLAWHRLSRLFDLGILNDGNRHRATLIKTYVTTELQKAVALDFGVRCVETLTGFKYIGAKLRKYEEALPEDVRSLLAAASPEQRRALLLEHSTYFVFGGEESYGYSAGDLVRDKDANAAALMVVEAAAFARSSGRTLRDLLDDLYLRHGVHAERGESIVMEGADGAQRITALVQSYRERPPEQMAGRRVLEARDFSQGPLYDSEGDELPREAMMLFELEGGFRVAVRPSGTEPKIKYYLFGVAKGYAPISRDALPTLKKEVSDELEKLWRWLQEDILKR